MRLLFFARFQIPESESGGINVIDTIAKTRKRRILYGVTVYYTPSILPAPDTLRPIVASAGGIFKAVEGPLSQADLKSSLVVSTEKDFRLCSQALPRTTQVYSSDIILNGILEYKIDRERWRLARP